MINLEKRGYIYRHIRLDKNEPFYIGIGGFSKREKEFTYKRAYNKSTRNKIWKKIVAKTDYEIEILLENLTWEEACEKEKEFILLYGRLDLKTGTLTNLTDGGDGTIGISDEARRKISERQIGEKNHMYGKKTPDSVKKKIVASTIGEKNHMYGKNHTEESKLKMSDSLKVMGHEISERQMGEKNHMFVKGYCFNKLNKKYIVRITINGVRKHIGCYTTELEAAKAYEDAKEKYYK